MLKKTFKLKNNNELLLLLFKTYRSMPSCNKNVTKPNAAGALCNMIARKTMISTS